MKCKFCGSFSPDDARGNCSACGAPRSEEKIEFEQIEVTSYSDRERIFIDGWIMSMEEIGIVIGLSLEKGALAIAELSRALIQND